MVVINYPGKPLLIREAGYANPDPYTYPEKVDNMQPGPYPPQEPVKKKEDENMCMLCCGFTGRVLYMTICDPCTWISYFVLDSLDGKFCNNWCCLSY